jgi:hypothetical protein
MDRGNEVLLIGNLPPAVDVGPPAPAGMHNPSAEEAAAAAAAAAEATAAAAAVKPKAPKPKPPTKAAPKSAEAQR